MRRFKRTTSFITVLAIALGVQVAVSPPAQAAIVITNNTAPSISGTAAVGQVLTTSNGTWTPTPGSYSYVWKRGATVISGATSSTYQLVAADLGQTITSVVTANAGAAHTSATSAATSAVVVGTQSLTPTPTLSSPVSYGTAATATPGTWDIGVSLAYQWDIDGSAIPGATASTYTPVLADLGKALTVAVTGTKDGYTAVTKTSASATVGRQSQTLSPSSTVITASDGFAYGSTLSLTPYAAGDWDSGVTLSYQWQRDGLAISGATNDSYVLTLDDIGALVRLCVTSTKAGFTDVVSCSASHLVSRATQGSTPAPIIAGHIGVADELVAVAQGWDSGVTFTFQWFLDGAPIDGANTESYTPVLLDYAHVLSVRATGSKAGYTDASVTSSDYTVGLGILQIDYGTGPYISGVDCVDGYLEADPGTWEPGVTISYQWLIDGYEIVGATSSSYVPVPDDVGGTITVVVIGSKEGYEDAYYESAGAYVYPADIINGGQSITGEGRYGSSLTADISNWVAGADISYQWYLGSQPIDGATSATYTPALSDIGQYISVAVSGTKYGYTSYTANSSGILIQPGDQASAVNPTITGAVSAESEVGSAVSGWLPGTSITYQWLLDGTEIAGATAATYTPTISQIGHQLAVSATGKLEGYQDLTLTSDAVNVASGVLTQIGTPTILGNLMVGQTLSVDTGDWGIGVTFDYQWYRDGALISGATGSGYTAVPSDFNHNISVVITGNKFGYASQSATSDPVSIALGYQFDIGSPSVTGDLQAGSVLTANPGSWPEGVTFSYQWWSGGVPRSGETASTYTTVNMDYLQYISVEVTAHREGYLDRTVTGVSSGRVRLENQALTGTPVIQGVARVGNVLTGLPGNWDDGVALTYVWLRDGDAIAGATSTTYQLTDADRWHDISFLVVSSKTGYLELASASSPVTPASRVLAIRGTPRVGGTLTVDPGVWNDGTSFSYQWVANGRPISGATSSSLTLTAAQYLTRIQIRVTGVLGQLSTTKVSPLGSQVLAGTIATVGSPTISGGNLPGDTLTADPGVWSDGVSLSYSWLRGGRAIARATGSSYVITAADQGKSISVQVRATAPGYSSASSTSSAISVDNLSNFAGVAAPVLSGAAKVGQQLTVDAGSWDSGVSYSYVWRRNGLTIDGVTGSSYTLTSQDLGARITVLVTGSKRGWVTKSMVSNSTVKVSR